MKLDIEDSYLADKIENQVQHFWKDHIKSSSLDSPKNCYYCLEQFPYPSGKLHMGHVRVYTIGDAIARFRRQKNFTVFHPIGFDAFGLPAERAAIEQGIDPKEWTNSNINTMRKQLKAFGFSYDWDHELITCEPNYYHWEQWLFLKMWQRGLVYRQKREVNWDPVDETVLANEQVINGCGWRSGARVVRKSIPQWFFKITAYSKELLRDLDSLSGWPEALKVMQRNWIGESKGVEISFDLKDRNEMIKVFTTRADTIYGVTFLAVALDHPLVVEEAKKNHEIKIFLDSEKSSSTAEKIRATKEKRGRLLSVSACHPLTGKTIPIFVANYVLSDYGSSAVMGVPAHDDRDLEFACYYGIEIKTVIVEEKTASKTKQPFCSFGYLINSGNFTGLESKEAERLIIKELIEKKRGEEKIKYRLRDWSISRQRTWGVPIPVIYCPQCGPTPVAEDQLPVLPETKIARCTACGKKGNLETDTLDTFVDSSFYFIRFLSPNQTKSLYDQNLAPWLPVTKYLGGIEHAILHLLYARFIYKVLADMKMVPGREPFSSLLTQGMVLKNGKKMSKSQGNVVDPTPLLKKYGADTLRFFVLFAAPPEQGLEWSDSGIEGSRRFLERLHSFCSIWQKNRKLEQVPQPANNLVNSNDQIPAWLNLSRILKQINYDIEKEKFNTVASGTMKLLNFLNDQLEKFIAGTDQERLQLSRLLDQGIHILLRVLNPLTPHISQYHWQKFSFQPTLIEEAPWPEIEGKLQSDNTSDIALQINGKFKTKISIKPEIIANENLLLEEIKKNETLKKYLLNKSITRVISVPNRVINILTK